MNTLEKQILETIKTLPTQQMADVLYFAENLKAKQNQLNKENALATLAKYKGRFKADKFNREACYDN